MILITKTSDQTRQRGVCVCVCVCVCVRVFIKLHITTYATRINPTQGGTNDIYYENMCVCVYF